MTNHMTIPIRTVLEGVCDLVLGLMTEIEARRYEIHWKPDGSPVTEADTYLETMIEEYLRETLPQLEFVGEETYRPGVSAFSDWVAVLDPIDGTENFCSGLKEWGVSLSLWHDRKHAGSLLLLPELGERIMSGDEPPALSSRIVGFSSSISEELAAQLTQAGEARITGCAVYNLFNVIRGSFTRFVNPVGAYSWDLLAGISLALEFGCEVVLDGQPYDGDLLEPGRKYRVDIRHGRSPRSRQGSLAR